MISALVILRVFGNSPPRSLGLRADAAHYAYWPHPKTKHAADLAAALRALR